MDSTINKPQGNRENLYSFGNLKKETNKLNVEAFNQANFKMRMQTKPETKYRPIRQVLAPKNTVYCENNDRRTPSFNEQSFEKPLVYEVPRYKYSQTPSENVDICDEPEFFPQPSQQTAQFLGYHYNPTIEDITKKYGIHLKNPIARQSFNHENSRGRQTNYIQKEQRSYSNIKLPRKAPRQPTQYAQDSFDQDIISNRYKLRQRSTTTKAYFKADKAGNVQPAFFAQNTESCYPNREPSYSVAPPDHSNRQTIDSINALDMRINEKMNRILHDEYSYY